LAGKEPFLGLILTQIGFQFRKKSFGKDSVTILSAFTLLNPDQHPGRVTLNVVGFQPNGFANAKSGTVNGLQQNPMLEIFYTRKYSRYFFHAVNNREF
jgi:hypothetical protein